MRYKVRNWEQYQHYSKRNPPWVKLYYETLSSRDWVSLSDSGRVLVISCILIASRNDGWVPNDPEYLKRVAYLNTTPDFSELLATGFLCKEEDFIRDSMLAESSSTLADSNIKKQDASLSVSVSASVSEGGVGETINGLPEILSTPEFKSTWTKWRVYKKQQGWPVQPMQEIELWTKLAAEGHDVAVEVVLNSIRKGWKNIIFDYPEKPKPRGRDPHYPSPDEVEAAALKRQKELDDDIAAGRIPATRQRTRADAGESGNAKPRGVQRCSGDSAERGSLPRLRLSDAVANDAGTTRQGRAVGLATTGGTPEPDRTTG